MPKAKPIERYYYIHIPTALEGPERIEDALIGLDNDKKLKTNFGRDIALDLSTRELECRQLYFPCSEIMNSDGWEESLNDYAPEQFGQYMKFRQKVLSTFRTYQLPIIRLYKETSKEAVCLVFEKVNTGGVSLSVFELMTAGYAADGYNLRDDWYGNSVRKVPSRYNKMAKEPMLQVVETTDFLQAITMLHTLEQRRADIAMGKEGKQIAAVSAKRAAILSLPLQAYQKWLIKWKQDSCLRQSFFAKNISLLLATCRTARSWRLWQL